MVCILFICHGNICCSTMAEYVMKHLVLNAGLEDAFEIESAATSREEIGNDIHPGTRQVLQKHGIVCVDIMRAARWDQPTTYTSTISLAWTRRTLPASIACYWERRAWATRGGQ